MAERFAARSSRHQTAYPAAAAWADTAPAELTFGRLAQAVQTARAETGGQRGAGLCGTPRTAAAAPPRDYTAGATLASKLGTARAASLTARRSFVALKLTYLEATAMLHGAESEWLREQVRTAEEPIDLWLLRAPLFASLAGHDPERRRLRQRLRRAIAALFGEPQPTTAFASLR